MVKVQGVQNRAEVIDIQVHTWHLNVTCQARTAEDYRILVEDFPALEDVRIDKAWPDQDISILMGFDNPEVMRVKDDHEMPIRGPLVRSCKLGQTVLFSPGLYGIPLVLKTLQQERLKNKSNEGQKTLATYQSMGKSRHLGGATLIVHQQALTFLVWPAKTYWQALAFMAASLIKEKTLMKENEMVAVSVQDEASF